MSTWDMIEVEYDTVIIEAIIHFAFWKHVQPVFALTKTEIESVDDRIRNDENEQSSRK